MDPRLDQNVGEEPRKDFDDIETRSMPHVKTTPHLALASDYLARVPLAQDLIGLSTMYEGFKARRKIHAALFGGIALIIIASVCLILSLSPSNSPASRSDEVASESGGRMKLLVEGIISGTTTSAVNYRASTSTRTTNSSTSTLTTNLTSSTTFIIHRVKTAQVIKSEL